MADILTVRVTFDAARNLRETETFGTQDPYVVAQVLGQDFKGKVCENGGKNPSTSRGLVCVCVMCDPGAVRVCLRRVG